MLIKVQAVVGNVAEVVVVCERVDDVDDNNEYFDYSYSCYCYYYYYYYYYDLLRHHECLPADTQEAVVQWHVEYHVHV